MSEMTPELVGEMAAVGTTSRPLGMCPSCSRALIYGALMYAGAVQGNIQSAYIEVQGGDTSNGLAQLDVAEGRQHSLLSILTQFVHADFDACMAPGAVADDEEWSAAMDAFLRSRIATYVNANGQIEFEPHEEPDL